MRLPNWELEKLRMEHEKKEAELTKQRAEARYWRELKHQYVGMILQGMMMSDRWEQSTREEMAAYAIEAATALVEKLKNE